VRAVFRRNVGPRLAGAPEGFEGNVQAAGCACAAINFAAGRDRGGTVTILPFTTSTERGPGKRPHAMCMCGIRRRRGESHTEKAVARRA
jgi:hypothetical protein